MKKEADMTPKEKYYVFSSNPKTHMKPLTWGKSLLNQYSCVNHSFLTKQYLISQKRPTREDSQLGINLQ